MSILETTIFEDLLKIKIKNNKNNETSIFKDSFTIGLLKLINIFKIVSEF